MEKGGEKSSHSSFVLVHGCPPQRGRNRPMRKTLMGAKRAPKHFSMKRNRSWRRSVMRKRVRYSQRAKPLIHAEPIAQYPPHG